MLSRVSIMLLMVNAIFRIMPRIEYIILMHSLLCMQYDYQSTVNSAYSEGV